MALPVTPELSMTPLHPKKLLLTKWTAVQPVDKNKHFLVSKVMQPEPPCPGYRMGGVRGRVFQGGDAPALASAARPGALETGVGVEGAAFAIV